MSINSRLIIYKTIPSYLKWFLTFLFYFFVGSVKEVVKNIHKDYVDRKIKMMAQRRELMDGFDQDFLKRMVHQMYAKKEFVSI